MGLCSEILTKKYNLKRDNLDKFALESQKRAQKARDNGYFKNEIAPIEVKWTNPDTKKVENKLIEHDDGIRDNTTLEQL